MNISLHGRNALVTGGSKGIGASISTCLALSGARVAVVGRDITVAQTLCDTLPACSPHHLAITADLAISTSAAHAVQTATKHFGSLDIVVCNAGGPIVFGSLEELSDDAWLDSFRLNLMHIVNVVRAALPYLRESPHARVILISSLSGLEPERFNPHYTTMKAATINLGKYLANTYAADDILINTICPGKVKTPGMDDSVSHIAIRDNQDHAATYESFLAREAAKIPLGRLGHPDEIGSLVSFLSSDFGSWITGSSFVLDGGKSAHL